MTAVIQNNGSRGDSSILRYKYLLLMTTMPKSCCGYESCYQQCFVKHCSDYSSCDSKTTAAEGTAVF